MLIKLNELIQTVKQTGSNQFPGSKPIPIVHFLFCLADSDNEQRYKTETLAMLGGLGHPKYDEFAPDWLKEGRYHGHTDENKILTLDRIDRNKKYFKNTDLKIFGDRGNIIRCELNGAKDPLNAIAKSLWPSSRSRTFAGIFDYKVCFLSKIYFRSIYFRSEIRWIKNHKSSGQ